MASSYERLPEEGVEISLGALARMLRMADAHEDCTPLLEEHALSKTDQPYLSNFRYCIEVLSRSVAIAAFADYQEAIKIAMGNKDQKALEEIVPPPEQAAFFGGVVAGISAGWHQFGGVASLFPAIGEVADLVGIGRDLAPINPDRAVWIEAAMLDLADHGVQRFSGMELYYQKVQSALCPSGEHAEYTRRGIGLGMLIYEEATKFQPQPH